MFPCREIIIELGMQISTMRAIRDSHLYVHCTGTLLVFIDIEGAFAGLYL